MRHFDGPTISLLGCLLLAASASAFAEWAVQYEGPDTLTIVARPNTVATNARGAATTPRELANGRLAAMLSPLVAKALEGCAMDDVTRVVISPRSSPDWIGGTMTHVQGFGVYINLSLADRVSTGNWYIAPFFAVHVALADASGKEKDSVDFLEYNKGIIDRDEMTQERFMDVRTADLDAAVATFAQGRLPGVLRKAFARRCASAGG